MTIETLRKTIKYEGKIDKEGGTLRFGAAADDLALAQGKLDHPGGHHTEELRRLHRRSSGDESHDSGMLSGVIVAALAFIAFLIFLLYCCCGRWEKIKQCCGFGKKEEIFRNIHPLHYAGDHNRERYGKVLHHFMHLVHLPKLLITDCDGKDDWIPESDVESTDVSRRMSIPVPPELLRSFANSQHSLDSTIDEEPEEAAATGPPMAGWVNGGDHEVVDSGSSCSTTDTTNKQSDNECASSDISRCSTTNYLSEVHDEYRLPADRTDIGPTNCRPDVGPVSRTSVQRQPCKPNEPQSPPHSAITSLIAQSAAPFVADYSPSGLPRRDTFPPGLAHNPPRPPGPPKRPTYPYYRPNPHLRRGVRPAIPHPFAETIPPTQNPHYSAEPWNTPVFNNSPLFNHPSRPRFHPPGYFPSMNNFSSHYYPKDFRIFRHVLTSRAESSTDSGFNQDFDEENQDSEIEEIVLKNDIDLNASYPSYTCQEGPPGSESVTSDRDTNHPAVGTSKDAAPSLGTSEMAVPDAVVARTKVSVPCPDTSDTSSKMVAAGKGKIIATRPGTASNGRASSTGARKQGMASKRLNTGRLKTSVM